MASLLGPVLGGAAGVVRDIGYPVAAGLFPTNPAEYAYKYFVFEPLKREIMQDVTKYLTKKVAHNMYDNVRGKIRRIGTTIQRLTNKFPDQLKSKVATKLQNIFELNDLGEFTPSALLDKLKQTKTYTIKKAKEYGILTKKYSEDTLRKIANMKDIAKYAEEKGMSGTKDWANTLLNYFRGEGKTVFNNGPNEGTDFSDIAELFKRNSTHPVMEEQIDLVQVPEGELKADFLGGDKGIIDQNAKKRLRGFRGDIELKGSEVKDDGVIGDLDDLVESMFGVRKKIKLSKGAKIAKDLLKGDLPSQFSNVSISDVPTVVNRVNKANRQRLHYNTFKAGRSNDYIPTQTMVNFLKNKF